MVFSLSVVEPHDYGKDLSDNCLVNSHNTLKISDKAKDIAKATNSRIHHQQSKLENSTRISKMLLCVNNIVWKKTENFNCG